MNFKNLIFISYLFSFLIGQAISTPKTIKPLVELSAIDQFSLVTFIGAEGTTNSGGVVDYKTIKLYSITKNNNLVDYKQIFEFPLSEQSPSYFSGAHLGDITGDGENELILFISNPNTGTQIMSFTINAGFVFKKLHDPYLIKSNQKQPTLLSSGLATIYEDKDKEIVVSFGAPERKAVIINYNGELEPKVIAKNFLANSVGVIKILTPDLNEDNISDIYILSNSPNLKEEKIYLSPKHEDTNESKIVALKENIKDVCFVQINDNPRPSKVFLLNESKIYVENIDRYFDLPIKDSSLLTAVDNKNLFSMNKRGDLIIFRIFNNGVDIKENLVPGFKNNSYTEMEYLILKNRSILLSHNGKAEIILQSLENTQPADQAKKERQETIVVDTDKKTSLAGNDDKKVTAAVNLESVNQANMKQTKTGLVGVENKLDDILSQDKEKKNNTPKLNTTLMRDTIIVNVGENAVININLNKEYSFIGLEKEIGPKGMELDRSKLIFEWIPSSKELGYNELKYQITYNTSIEFEEYFEKGIQKLKQKETLSRSLYSTMIFVNAAPEIKVSPSNLYEIQAEEELIVPIYINDPNPEDQNLLTINMEPILEGAKIENRKFYWTPRKKHLGTNNIKLNVSDGRLSDQVNIEVLVDTLKVESREVIEEYATVNEEFLHKIPMALDAKTTIIEAPENVRISSDGYIHWIPTKPQLESNRIILEVKEKTQTFLYRLRVFVNAPPVISYRPDDINYLEYGEKFKFILKSFDENENQLLFWSLLEGPNTMELENANIYWEALSPDFNPYAIKLSDTIDSDIFYGEIYVNDIPIFISTPIEYVALGEKYEYKVEVADKNEYNMKKEKNLVELFLKTSPEGMIIENNNIKWNPKEGQVGANFIEIEAFDGINKANQSFAIFVNDIPQIISRDSLQIEIGKTLHHFIKAQDANTSSKITYGIQSDLRDLTISPKTGEIIWTPAIEDVGYHTINASVSDEFSDLGKAVQPITIFVYKNPQFDNALLPEAYAESNYKQTITATNMFNQNIPEKDVFINLVESTFQEIIFDQLTYELSILPRLDEVGLQYVTLEVADQHNNKNKESFPISVLTSPCEIADTTYFNEDDPHKIERSTSTIQKQYIKKKPTILEKTGDLIKKEPAQYMTIEEINITEIIDTVFLTTVEVKKYFPELSEVMQNQEVSSELSKKELRKLKKLQREKEKKARKEQKVQKEKIQSNNITFNKVKEETNFSDKVLFIKPEAPLPKKIDLYKVKNEVKRKTVLAIMDDLKQNIIKSADNTKTQKNLLPFDQKIGHNLRGIKTPLNDKWKKKEYLNVLDFTTPEFNYKINSWNGFTGERKVN